MVHDLLGVVVEVAAALEVVLETHNILLLTDRLISIIVRVTILKMEILMVNVTKKKLIGIAYWLSYYSVVCAAAQ